MSLTYGKYLMIDELLSLQQRRSDEHDEMLFITIHQVYELWFKTILHEMDFLLELLEKNNTPRALQTFKRILTILKIMVAQIDVLETMTPLDYLSFRERLESGSGFQSRQFRELEFLLGHKRMRFVEHFPEGSEDRQILEQRYVHPGLWDKFLQYLSQQKSCVVPEEALHRDITQPVEASEAVQKMLIGIYRNNPDVAQVCERLVDLDEGVQEWRYRHVKMVERTIGTKQGTGGSEGVNYLVSTLLKPVFPDLWIIRTEF